MADYGSSPLNGFRILVTRSRHQQSSLSEPLRKLGAAVIPIPLIELQPISDPQHELIYQRLPSYDWIVFTSVNAVDIFVAGMKQRGLDQQILSALKIACVGPVTAQRLQRYNLTAEIIPQQHVAEGLAASFDVHHVASKRFLLPRAETARDVLPLALKSRGAQVEVMTTYRTRATRLSEKQRLLMNASDLDAVTFTSSSTVHALEKWIEGEEQVRFRTKVLAFCIGPITGKTAQTYGYRQIITASTHSVAGLIESLSAELPRLAGKDKT